MAYNTKGRSIVSYLMIYFLNVSYIISTLIMLFNVVVNDKEYSTVQFVLQIVLAIMLLFINKGKIIAAIGFLIALLWQQNILELLNELARIPDIKIMTILKAAYILQIIIIIVDYAIEGSGNSRHRVKNAGWFFEEFRNR